MRKSILRWISYVVLVAFTFTAIVPIQAVYALNQTSSKSVINKQQGNAEKETALEKVVKQLTQLEEGLEANQWKNDKKEAIQAIQQTIQTINSLQNQVKQEFQQTTKKLNQLRAVKGLEKHLQFTESYNNQIARLQGDLESLLKTLEVNKQQSFNEEEYMQFREMFQAILDEASPDPQQKTLGNDLPYRNKIVDSTNKEESKVVEANTVIYHALSPINDSINQYLEETIETQQTEQIQELVKDLENDPVKMYEYVRNTIEFEPYFGSRKGADGSLAEKGGNAYDQASLLIALYRNAGIPARYVRGTVEITEEEAMAWTGADSSADASRVLASSGIPVTRMVSAGKVGSIRLEHVWVEAYLQYSNYRGIPNGSGEKLWVSLDPSFKAYEKIDGINVDAVPSINMDELAEQILTNSIIDESKQTLTNWRYDYLWKKMDNANIDITNYLAANDMEGATFKEIFGGKDIVDENLGLLPSSLPYRTVNVAERFNEVPASQMEWVEISLSGASPFGSTAFTTNEELTFKASTSQLSNKKITVSWVPASEEDQSIIDAYDGIYNTPAYLVEMKPQLKLEGEVVAEGAPVGLGYQQNLHMEFKNALGEIEKTNQPLTVGGYYAIGLNLQHIAPSNLEKRAENISNAANSLTTETILNDEGIGEMLYGTAVSYFAQVDAYDAIMSEKFNVSSIRQTSKALTALDTRVSYLFFSPVDLSMGGMYIDVDHNIVTSISLHGNQQDQIEYMKATGMIGSAMEHSIFEELFGISSVSSIKALGLANAYGIPIHTVTTENVEEVLPQLQVSSIVKSEIQSAIQAGNTVTIPEQELEYLDWKGVGYIVYDSDTGAAGYKISGGYAGGSTFINLDSVAVSLALFSMGSSILSIAALSSAVVIGGGIGPILLISLEFYSLYDDFTTLQRFMEGDPSARNELFINALFIVGSVSIIKFLENTKSTLLKPALSANSNRIIETIDTYNSGAATRLINKNFDADFIHHLKMKNINPELFESILRDDNFSISHFPGVTAFLQDGIKAGELTISDAGKLSGRVSINLKQAMKKYDEFLKLLNEGKLEEANKVKQSIIPYMSNLSGAYTEHLAKATSRDNILKMYPDFKFDENILVDLSHTNNPGIDFSYFTPEGKLRILEAKSSKDTIGFPSLSTMFRKEVVNGETTYTFKADFLDGIRKKHGRKVEDIVKNNFYNDNLEIELFVNSPKGVTEELVKLNGNVIDGIKIIITNINK